jgi:hypothetical protein
MESGNGTPRGLQPDHGNVRLTAPAAFLKIVTLFRSVYSPQDSPKVLFCCIEDCQEVQILGEDPYTPQQLLNNAVHLLLQCGLYTRNFNDWDKKIAADKIWTNLKTFVQECYTHQLNMTIITASATSVMVMRGTPMKNICPATNPLNINLPDRKVVKSTHVCDLKVPGLPYVLEGHIIPNLTVASLIGIRILCNVGCIVVFMNAACHVMYR